MHGICNLEHPFPTWPLYRKLNCLGKTFRRASHTVWKIALWIYIYLYYFIIEWFDFFFFFFFFFDGVTVNPNITKQEDTAFFCQKSRAFIGSDNHVQILSMPSSAGVKSLSFINTPCKIYSHRNYHFFCLSFFYWEYTRMEPSTFSWWFLTSPVLTYRYNRHFRTSRET